VDFDTIGASLDGSARRKAEVGDGLAGRPRHKGHRRPIASAHWLLVANHHPSHN
jgi:hypothetical protein